MACPGEGEGEDAGTAAEIEHADGAHAAVPQLFLYKRLILYRKIRPAGVIDAAEKLVRGLHGSIIATEAGRNARGTLTVAGGGGVQWRNTGPELP